MKRRKLRSVTVLAAAIAAVSVACSPDASKDAAKPDDTELIIEPAPGNYDYGPIAIFKKKRETDGGMIEFQQSDGKWAGSFECVEDNPSGWGCVNVAGSKIVSYRISSGGVDGKTKTAEYKISPKAMDLTLNGVVFNEEKTICSISLLGLQVKVRLKNDAKISAGKVAALLMKFDPAKLGNELVVGTEETGVKVIEASDDLGPAWPAYYGRSDSAAPKEKCILKLTEFKAGGKAKGEVACDSLPGNSIGREFGPTLTINKGEWQCDEWRR